MELHNDIRSAAALKQALGDPQATGACFSYAARVAADDRQAYPADAFEALNDWGLHHYYVPAPFGGKLSRFDELGALVRVVSRRDLAVSISHAVSFLGSMCMWLGGAPEQKSKLARKILGGKRISLALTEKNRGGDLLSVDMRARRDGDGFVLDGEKWLINGASRNPMVTVFARTDDRGGPRGFSLFLLDKDQVPAGWSSLNKIETLGVRAADISGIRLDGACLPADAMIGGLGHGFEIVLKALQLSRTLCGSLSLGAADTCLAVTLDYALQRRLYGKTVTALPQSQRLLSEAWAELLIGDSLTSIALRGLQVVPQQASVHSAVVKYLVPTLMEQSIQKLSVVLGSRFYLREDHAGGIFQKMLRDNLLIGLFDGSTVVNLYALSFQLRALLAQRNAETDTRAIAMADRSSPLPSFDWSALALSSGGHDSLYGSLAASLSELDRYESSLESGTLTDSLAHSVCVLRQGAADLAQRVHELPASAQMSAAPVLFELSRRYCVMTAAAAVLLDWRTNRTSLAGTLGDPAVLALVLNRIEAALGAAPVLPAELYRAAFERLVARFDADRGSAPCAEPELTPARVAASEAA
jgi:alkylation response protein AidB-like acyl-CoA dehydrogenase